MCKTRYRPGTLDCTFRWSLILHMKTVRIWGEDLFWHIAILTQYIVDSPLSNTFLPPPPMGDRHPGTASQQRFDKVWYFCSFLLFCTLDHWYVHILCYVIIWYLYLSLSINDLSNCIWHILSFSIKKYFVYSGSYKSWDFMRYYMIMGLNIRGNPQIGPHHP